MALNAAETIKRDGGVAAQVASLLVVEGDQARTVELDREIVLGRAPDVAVRLQDEGVSRRHARIAFNDGAWEVHDLDSHNGTYVNQRLIAGRARLEPGDVVGIGGATVVVLGLGGPSAFDRTLPWDRFNGALVEAIEVALRSGATLSVAAFHLATPSPSQAEIVRALRGALNAGDLGAAASKSDFVVLLSDAADPTIDLARITAVLAPFDATVRAGLARFPRDGVRADVLLLAAREAARGAESGQFAEHGERTELMLGDRRLVVADPATRGVYALLTRLATSQVSVLISGETGVGKENAAFALHHYSRRSAGPFVALNCAAMQDTLAESELFGHERGAFTGAVSTRIGVFESAHGGTLFLDEVGELSPAVQAKLLRTLETKTVTRVGSNKPIEVDVRVVAATHRALEEEVGAGRFRKDLFFRLAAAVVPLPPLRSRPIELALLARLFLDEACRRDGHKPMTLSAGAMNALQRYPWPGNIRELKNTLEVIVAASPSSIVEAEHLPARITGVLEKPGPISINPDHRPLSEELAELETRRIIEALEATHGSQTEAAELLGMPRRTLVFKMRRMRAEGVFPNNQW